ncbi:MAG: alpha/beta fold hydrolase [Verrucomicrobiales bacterium]|nr:alpha/beta fold hydrolase [Verrucomicrobiales bacterium]
MKRTLQIPLLFCLFLNPVAPLSADDEPLPRRCFFGAHLAPLSEKIDGNEGVLLRKIIPDSPAADAGLIDGDIVLRAEGADVVDVDTLQKSISVARAGDTWTLEIARGVAVLEKQIQFQEVPRFRDDFFHLDYGHVVSHGARLRTLVGRPKNDRPHPAVLLLQGGGNFSIDNPTGPATSFTRIARHLSRNGYVTIRVDRRGCGDSEGPPVRDMDFLTELDGYRQALAALRKFEFVDQSRIFIFGHSLGGLTGPILASETPVRGIASYGTISGTHFEHIMAQRRSFATLDGAEPAEVEKRIERELQFWYPLLIEKLTPKEIRAKGPGVAETMDKLGISHPYIFYRPYTWLHQASEVNLGEVWTKVASTPLEIEGHDPIYPRVLSIWGTADWVCEKKPILWINEIVNRARPGIGKFIALDSSDHYFFRSDSFQESYGYFKPPPGGPYGKFNPAILTTLRSWLKETSDNAEPL